MRVLPLLLLCLAPPAGAHPLAPSLLDVRVAADGVATVTFKTPLSAPSRTRIEPRLPEHCAPVTEPHRERSGSGVVASWQVDCGATGFVGERVGFAGLARAGTNAVVRVELPDGSVQQGVVHGAAPDLEIVRAPTFWGTLTTYGRLGVGHILGGLDHLLFVAGLLLLVRRARALVTTITAFTLGHSVTLSAAALGFVQAPSSWMELGIAASIVWLAAEVVRSSRVPAAAYRRRNWRRPALLAGGFGLLHGFGFAGALAELGLPATEIPAALAGFNVGIELGQLGFVALWVTGVAALGRLRLDTTPRLRVALGYALGSVASLWMFERAAILF